MPSLNMLLLESTLKKLSPINDCEKVDLLIATLQEQRIPHTNEVELQVLYEIRKSKIQLYFKEQWKKMGPTIKKPTMTPAPSPTMPKVASKPIQPAPFQGKKHKKKMKKNTHLLPLSVPLPMNRVKLEKSTYIDPFEMVARREERMAQNRDKRVQPGYSSTGVKLPTAQAIKERKEKLQHYREVYYTNKKHKDADDPKRGNGYIYIDTPM